MKIHVSLVVTGYKNKTAKLCDTMHNYKLMNTIKANSTLLRRVDTLRLIVVGVVVAL